MAPRILTNPAASDEPDGENVGLGNLEADAAEQRLAVTDEEEPDIEQVGPSARPFAAMPLEADPVDAAEQHEPVALDDEHPDKETTTPPRVDYHHR